MTLPDARKQMVEDHLYLVDIVAKKIRQRLPRYVDFDFSDLVGYGYIGLVDAGIKFDESRGLKFNTYAGKRIEGAILDGIRKMDWLTQGLRRRKYVVDKPVSLSNVYDPEEDVEKDIADTKDNINDRMLVKQCMMSVLLQLEWKRFCSLYMRFFEGYKEREIGEMVGVTASRISQVTIDGKRQLKKVLGDEWQDGILSF